MQTITENMKIGVSILRHMRSSVLSCPNTSEDRRQQMLDIIDESEREISLGLTLSELVNIFTQLVEELGNVSPEFGKVISK